MSASDMLVGTNRPPFTDCKSAIKAHWPNENGVYEATRQLIYSRKPGSAEVRDRLLWDLGALYKLALRIGRGAEHFIELIEIQLID